MRRLLIALLFVFASLPVAGVNTVVVMRHAAAAGGFCTPFEECDEFNTTNNPATGWTAGPSSGAWQTNGTQMVPPAGSVTALLNNTVAGTTTEYAIVKIVEADDEIGVFVRRTSDSGYYYRLYWSGTQAFWAIHTSSDDSYNIETAGCGTTAFTDGDYMAALVTGTGTGTIARIWNKGQTAPTSAPTTGDACSTLCCEWTDDLGTSGNNYADSGDRIGLYVYTGSTVRRFDDFAGGGS